MLVFLAPDSRALDNLKDAVRSSLAWSQIVRDKTRHNLTQGALAQAEAKEAESKSTFDTRLREAWNWIIYPLQVSAHEEFGFSASKLSSQDRLFDRMQKKLEGDGALFSTLGPNNLNGTLESYIWRKNPYPTLTCGVSQLHIYMQRLADQGVLREAILYRFHRRWLALCICREIR